MIKNDKNDKIKNNKIILRFYITKLTNFIFLNIYIYVYIYMKKELVYFSSGFGISIIIASLLNLSIKKMDKIILFWLWFGILAQIVHLLMHYNRIYKEKIGNSNLIIICTFSQILILYLYIKTRKYFKKFTIIFDLAMIQIVTIMIARAIMLFTNGNLYYES